MGSWVGGGYIDIKRNEHVPYEGVSHPVEWNWNGDLTLVAQVALPIIATSHAATLQPVQTEVKTLPRSTRSNTDLPAICRVPTLWELLRLWWETCTWQATCQASRGISIIEHLCTGLC
jgi:hypothetical protein